MGGRVPSLQRLPRTKAAGAVRPAPALLAQEAISEGEQRRDLGAAAEGDMKGPVLAPLSFWSAPFAQICSPWEAESTCSPGKLVIDGCCYWGNNAHSPPCWLGTQHGPVHRVLHSHWTSLPGFRCSVVKKTKPSVNSSSSSSVETDPELPCFLL